MVKKVLATVLVGDLIAYQISVIRTKFWLNGMLRLLRFLSGTPASSPLDGFYSLIAQKNRASVVYLMMTAHEIFFFKIRKKLHKIISELSSDPSNFCKIDF
jgi:hypothetical protein